ncbi:MAG: peptidylprolyl isomerase [archaeon]
MTIIKKNDFVEIEFTGRDSSNNQIFDTTDLKKAKEIGIENAPTIKPLLISVGNEMLLKGLDQDLEGKEVGKTYQIHLKPDKAFGKRNPQMIRTYNINSFKKNNVDPYPGMTLQLDNTIAKIISVSGGRVMIDFNNPLAGREIDYEYKINKIISDDNEKINAIQDFFLKQKYEFKIDKEKNKVIFKEKLIKPLIEMINPKFKEMTGFDFIVEEDKKENKLIDSKTSKKPQ